MDGELSRRVMAARHPGIRNGRRFTFARATWRASSLPTSRDPFVGWGITPVVPPTPPKVVEGIDRAWLESCAQVDPVAHAYAAFDLRFAPDRVRFISLRQGETTTAYLLLWFGFSGVPVVHWFGTPAEWPLLLPSLPPRPMVAVVPLEVAGPVRERRTPAVAYPLEILARPLGLPPPPEDGNRMILRLNPSDAPSLARLAEEEPAMITAVYRTVDLANEPVWGAFESGTLVAVARASVTLPNLWMLGGIFTRPAHRGRGWGRALTATVTRAAMAAGVRPALAVREDNLSALRIYQRLGYETVDHRVWVDAGAGLTP